MCDGFFQDYEKNIDKNGYEIVAYANEEYDDWTYDIRKVGEVYAKEENIFYKHLLGDAEFFNSKNVEGMLVTALVADFENQIDELLSDETIYREDSLSLDERQI